MKKFITRLFVLFFILQGVLFLRQPEEKILVNENRKINELPVTLRFTTSGIREFFREMDGYFTDRVIVRNMMLKAFARISHDWLNDIGDFNKAFRGKEDWLFLGNEYSDTLDKLTGKAKPGTIAGSNARINGIIQSMRNFSGIPRVFLIGPDKTTIYPEYLPDILHPSSIRYVSVEIEKLEDAGIDVVDPAEAMIANKALGLQYLRTDTHWNFLGASIAAQVLVDHLRSRPEFHDLALPEFTLEPAAHPEQGDLIKIGGFQGLTVASGDNYSIRWSEPRADLIRIDGDGITSRMKPDDIVHTPYSIAPVRVINPDAASPHTIWLFRDSFSNALCPFIHAMFAETVHFPGSYIQRSVKWDVSEPDLVLYEIVERSI